MQHDEIETLRQEAIHLGQLEIKILKKMIEQDILSLPQPQKEQTLDSISAPKIIEVVKGELHKLQELDMVLAVVGTMKAGKSTTINAIVGTEILPNRNAPMTAIPTLIRHTKGQIEPKLVFANYQPLNKLMLVLHQKITQPQYQEVIRELESDHDLQSLVKEIRHKKPINHQATGATGIFDFLKAVNDLVRIAPVFDVDFPFECYQNIEQLPVIEIEFIHLKEMEAGKGRLTLLDTPGPNEAGQTRLRPMLQDQLKKASAVLVVMDYTQLKSEADAQVREDLATIAATTQDRIYALVNKFDQKDRNGMDENEVRGCVTDLINNSQQKPNKESRKQEPLIKVEQVFPVSSKQAYLANRARHEMQLHGKLPNPKDHPWVDDFFDEAGIRKKFQDDNKYIQEALEELWTDSNFSNPLENVIKVANDQAALMALQSTVNKLCHYAVSIYNFLVIEEIALTKLLSFTQSIFQPIENDITTINECIYLLESERTHVDWRTRNFMLKIDIGINSLITFADPHFTTDFNNSGAQAFSGCMAYLHHILLDLLKQRMQKSKDQHHADVRLQKIRNIMKRANQLTVDTSYLLHTLDAV